MNRLRTAMNRLRTAKGRASPGRRRSERGSVSLEAALVLPGVLLLIWFFLGLLIADTAEIKLKGALDRTAAEISLLSPLARLLEYTPTDTGAQADGCEDTNAADLEQLVGELFPGFSLENLGADLLLDTSSTAILGQLVQQRLNYWLAEGEAGQPGWPGGQTGIWSACLVSRNLYLDWQIDRQQLWLCLSYQLQTPLGRLTRETRCVVPLWIGRDRQTETDSQDDDSVWLLDNFSRGQLLRQEMGGDLPYDFPVIANFDDGEAVSIKSMDLTAPGYQQTSDANKQVMEHLDDLAAFTGAYYEKNGENVAIDEGQIVRRRLILVVPANSGEEWLAGGPELLQTYAAARNLTLEVVTHGNSSRYAQEAAGSEESDPTDP